MAVVTCRYRFWEIYWSERDRLLWLQLNGAIQSGAGQNGPVGQNGECSVKHRSVGSKPFRRLNGVVSFYWLQEFRVCWSKTHVNVGKFCTKWKYCFDTLWAPSRSPISVSCSKTLKGVLTSILWMDLVDILHEFFRKTHVVCQQSIEKFRSTCAVFLGWPILPLLFLYEVLRRRYYWLPLKHILFLCLDM